MYQFNITCISGHIINIQNLSNENNTDFNFIRFFLLTPPFYKSWKCRCLDTQDIKIYLYSNLIVKSRYKYVICAIYKVIKKSS